MLALAVTRRLLAATIYVMACASFVTVSALAPFNHYPAYVTSSNVNVPADAAVGQHSQVHSTTRPVTTTAAPYEHYCKGRPDNYSAAEPGTKCRRYFRCHSPPGARAGHQQRPPSIYLCPGKLVFNGLKCVHPSEYQCHNNTLTVSPTTQPSVEVKVAEVTEGPKDCAERPDGYYQDGESGCRSYFYCTSGHKAVYVCPSRMVFDGVRCVEPDTYRCPFASSDCRLAGSGSGYFSDTKSGCRSYYFCSDGHKLVTLTCSDNRIFDGRKCVEPAHYRCPSDDAKFTASDYYAYSLASRNPSASFVYSPPQTYIITNKVNGPGSSTQRPPSVDECEKSYGFFVIPGTGCRQYYFCIAGSRTDLTCAGDTLFNGQVCVQPSQFYCPEEVQPSAPKTFDCRGKADGVYPDMQSGCQNYFLCHEEHPSEFACPHGQLFDGRKCSDSQTVVCAESEVDARTSGLVSNVCHGRANGLYSDNTWSGCRGFVYCRSGKQLGPPGQCGLAERFSASHNRCLPKHEVFCADDDEPFVDNSEIVTTYSEPVEATTLAE